MRVKLGLCVNALVVIASAVTIAQINGDRFLSSFDRQAVKNATGLVVAKGPSGIFLRSISPDDDPKTSEGIYVYNSSVGKNLTEGDIITFDANVSEYRSSSAYLYTTELIGPKNLVVRSSGNTYSPLVIGEDTVSPPRGQYTSLDGGDVLAVPNGEANVSTSNPDLDPEHYGLDFWESLSGDLVTVRNATAISRANQYGDTWVVGGWPTSGRNEHGGLTLSGKDANPEAIIIGSPLDGSSNPDGTKMGDGLGDITGVVTYAFGFYRILPLTALEVTNFASAEFPPATLTSTGSCKGVTVGDYNVENLMPGTPHLQDVARHIANFMKTPDLLFVQEIQDSTGATDDGIVDANQTLSELADAIEGLSGVAYGFLDIDPANNEDGGQPGGNIRTAYLYNSDVVQLHDLNPGSSADANEVLPGPALKYNPGLIDPANDAWGDSRKPLVAAWKPVGEDGAVFFTVNVHWTSKGGSSSLHGDPRPPQNGGVDKRGAQAKITGEFISKLLDEDPEARVIASGDFNEFAVAEPVRTFAETSGLLDLDEVARIPVNERYTYVYDMNSQELDHMFVSPALRTTAEFEHIHVNSWASYDDLVSDHDPSVARLDLCG